MEVLKKKEDSLLGDNLSSSFKRKSLLVQNASSPVLVENNDEAERLALHNELNASETLLKNSNACNKRRSLGLSFLAKKSAPEIAQHISDCIKLNTENKINLKNAFSLEIIDFMTYMISKQDANISNLQMASTSLDVSSKIYGFRVDSIHTEIMKMFGGLDRHDEENPTNDGNTDMNNEEINGSPKQKKKKRKRNKQKIFNTVDSLRGPIDVFKPSLWMREDQDVQTTDALYQVLLSNHATSGFYLHPYDDVVVDTIEDKTNNETIKITIPRIENLSEKEICPPLINFDFQDWSSNSEEKDTQNVETETKEDRFQFDLDASLPSEEDVEPNDINYVDVQDEEHVDKYIDAKIPQKKIVDLCKVVSNYDINRTSEYSFLQKNMNVHWAGPCHWKISNFINTFSKSKVVETCHQEQVKKKKEIILNYDYDSIATAHAKLTARNSKKSEICKANWIETDLILPRDMHYSIESATKLYLHKLIGVIVEKENELNATRVFDVNNYDYHNELDTSNYCPNVPNDDFEIGEDQEANECEPQQMQVFTNDDLVAAPKLTNKIAIAYSVQAKRIDMRQLKKSIWRSLTVKTEKSTEENVEENKNEQEDKMNESKRFSKIYKVLPKMLTKSNVEALSFPISFVSLLHLANEKTLKIQSLPDMSDITVEAS